MQTQLDILALPFEMLTNSFVANSLKLSASLRLEEVGLVDSALVREVWVFIHI